MPLVVRRTNKTHYKLIDGNARFDATQEDIVPCILLNGNGEVLLIPKNKISKRK